MGFFQVGVKLFIRKRMLPAGANWLVAACEKDFRVLSFNIQLEAASTANAVLCLFHSRRLFLLQTADRAGETRLVASRRTGAQKADQFTTFPLTRLALACLIDLRLVKIRKNHFLAKLHLL